MKLFIFDMGNVFLTGIAIIRNMAESIGIPEEALRSDYAEHEHALMMGACFRKSTTGTLRTGSGSR